MTGTGSHLARKSVDGTSRVAASTSFRTLALGLVLALSLCLGLIGNNWGAPDRWHPDEIDAMAAGMVAQKSLNPHFFPYGGLHYYTLALTAAVPVGVYNFAFDRKPAPSDERALAAWRDRKDARVHIMARSTSAVMATATVLIIYLIGALLFSRSIGLLAALLFAVSPYIVLIAHFSTVDTAANFWYWLACLLSLMSWKHAARPWLAVSAFAVGLATGTKIDRLLAVIPWITAGLLRQDPPAIRMRRLLICAALIPVGYVVANPTLLLSFYEFVDGTVKELAFNTLRGNGENSFASILTDTATGMGVAVFWISLVSTACLCVAAIRGHMRREVVWLMAATVPMYLVYGPHVSLPWYSTLMYPALAITAAWGCVTLGRVVGSRVTVVANLAVLAAVAWSLLCSVAVDQEFVHDSRYAAAKWIETEVPRGASIEISHRGPVLAAGMYDVRHDAIPQDYYDSAREVSSNLESSRLYDIVHGTLLKLRQLTDGLTRSSSQRPEYRAWFDRVITPPASPDGAGVESAPDYRVLVDYLDRTELHKLESPGSRYRLEATFHYRHPLGLDVPFAFLNPTVYVFKRIEGPA